MFLYTPSVDDSQTKVINWFNAAYPEIRRTGFYRQYTESRNLFLDHTIKIDIYTISQHGRIHNEKYDLSAAVEEPAHDLDLQVVKKDRMIFVLDGHILLQSGPRTVEYSSGDAFVVDSTHRYMIRTDPNHTQTEATFIVVENNKHYSNIMPVITPRDDFHLKSFRDLKTLVHEKLQNTDIKQLFEGYDDMRGYIVKLPPGRRMRINQAAALHVVLVALSGDVRVIDTHTEIGENQAAVFRSFQDKKIANRTQESSEFLIITWHDAVIQLL